MGRGRDRGDSKRGRGRRGSYTTPGGRNGGSLGSGGMLRRVLTLPKNVVKSATKTNIHSRFWRNGEGRLCTPLCTCLDSVIACVVLVLVSCVLGLPCCRCASLGMAVENASEEHVSEKSIILCERSRKKRVYTNTRLDVRTANLYTCIHNAYQSKANEREPRPPSALGLLYSLLMLMRQSNTSSRSSSSGSSSSIILLSYDSSYAPGCCQQSSAPLLLFAYSKTGIPQTTFQTTTEAKCFLLL